MGDTSIASDLGKKGTSTDISIFDKKTNDQIFSYCCSNTYPEKLQSLLQSIAISEYAILNITRLDSFLGEQMLALDIFNLKRGFILYSFEVDIEKVKNIIKKTNLSSFQIVDSLEQLKKHLSELKPVEYEENEAPSSDAATTATNSVYIPIDHVFDVKGVGTVVLGSIKQGEIKTYDELEINPLNKPVVIKSIQMHDDPVSHSKKFSRVGLAIKGVSAKDVSRGDIITSPGLSKIISDSFQIKFNKNPFFKEDIIETQNYMISVGLQIRTVKIKKIEGNEIAITLEKPIAYIKNNLCVVFSPDSKTMRIMGYGYMG
ncbi:MAG TPA: EF-Tu/IF-2/RF-3 family GTPase [Phototrophicaceae bacterium]|nr:EF-Tu/IF-2/RF-3 family GTPase [Phototrophicaceae bacterium]